MDSNVGKTFKLTKKLGSGAFGEIFHGINVTCVLNSAQKQPRGSHKTRADQC